MATTTTRKDKIKRIALGAAAGAVVATLIGVSYGATGAGNWDEIKRSLPQAILVGIGMGSLAALLGAPPLAAGLAVGTGLYVRNAIRGAITNGAGA